MVEFGRIYLRGFFVFVVVVVVFLIFCDFGYNCFEEMLLRVKDRFMDISRGRKSYGEDVGGLDRGVLFKG